MPNPTALTQRLPRRDASINWHTPHNPTQHTDASVPTLHNFFSQHFLPSNTVINYHHPSSSHHSSFLLYPLPRYWRPYWISNFPTFSYNCRPSLPIPLVAPHTRFSSLLLSHFQYAIPSTFTYPTWFQKIPSFLLSRFFRSTSPTLP